MVRPALVQHPPPQLRRQLPRRRRRPRHSVRQPRTPHRWRRRIIGGAIVLVIGALAWAALERGFAPTGNTSATRFDAIIVLGAGVDRDGNPTPVLLSRVTEGVHEYERGAAPRLILTGGPENGYNEAAVMTRIAQSEGVPASAIFSEPSATNTIHNACFSARIMKAHGWSSAEVVTSPSHLPRAGLIFARVPIAWSVHAAPPLEPQSVISARAASAVEVLHTLYYLAYARWAEPCSP